MLFNTPVTACLICTSRAASSSRVGCSIVVDWWWAGHESGVMI